MAYYNFGTWKGAGTPRWCADELTRDHLVPGPVKVAASDFTADAQGVKFIPGGTVLGRTITERNAGTGYGKAVSTDDEIFVLALDIDNAVENNDGVLLRPGSVVKENFLPGVGSLASGVLDLVRKRYICQRGAN